MQYRPLAHWVLSDVLHLMQIAPPNPSVVDLFELTEEALREFWVSEGLVQQEFTAGLPAAWAYVEQLRHLLRSILRFLRRSADEHREVKLSWTATARSFHLEFRSSAPGVLPESLFNPLGPNQLLTCRRIADNNGGRFSAEKDDRGWLCLRLDLPHRRTGVTGGLLAVAVQALGPSVISAQIVHGGPIPSMLIPGV